MLCEGPTLLSCAHDIITLACADWCGFCVTHLTQHMTICTSLQCKGEDSHGCRTAQPSQQRCLRLGTSQGEKRCRRCLTKATIQHRVLYNNDNDLPHDFATVIAELSTQPPPRASNEEDNADVDDAADAQEESEQVKRISFQSGLFAHSFMSSLSESNLCFATVGCCKRSPTLTPKSDVPPSCYTRIVSPNPPLFTHRLSSARRTK